MTEETPLVRQWILLRTLCARHHGATVKELADDMGVSEKTIRRDLEKFQQAGFPPEEVVEDHGRKKWRIDQAKYQPGLTFAYDEAIALHLARHLLEPLAGTPFWEAAQRAIKKIRSTLGARLLEYVDQFGSLFHQTNVGVSDYTKKGEVIDQLMLGIEDGRAVFITYQSLRATEPVTYDIYPYGLAYHRGSLYLVGGAPGEEGVRHWKVDRIEDAEVTQMPFHRPRDFELHDHLANSFGVFHGDGSCRVRVLFSSSVSRYVSESKWHHSQKLEPQKDGSLVASFELSDTEEIRHWILSFGRHAAVLEPESLREAMTAELRDMLQGYEAPSSARGRHSMRE